MSVWDTIAYNRILQVPGDRAAAPAAAEAAAIANMT